MEEEESIEQTKKRIRTEIIYYLKGIEVLSTAYLVVAIGSFIIPGFIYGLIPMGIITIIYTIRINRAMKKKQKQEDEAKS